MYILISIDEYNNNAELGVLITDQSTQYINGTECVYGQITAPKFATISSSLADGTYSVSDGEILFISAIN